jgi:dienelactone hydrolase
MPYSRQIPVFLLLSLVLVSQSYGQAPRLAGTAPLTAEGDLSAHMVAGIDRYLTRATADSVAGRTRFWSRDFSSPDDYTNSVEPNRARLRIMIGVVDQLVMPVVLSYDSGPDRPAMIAESDHVRVFAVRWTVADGFHAEGLLLEPKYTASAAVVAIPDADQTPEMLAGLAGQANAPLARRLAEAGCRVLVPTLLDRQCTWSGNPEIAMTDQTHREWIWRLGIEFGRHPIGYEVRKIEAAVRWLESQDNVPVGVAGYGEGGLLALYSASVGTRIDAALVSGYFQSRQDLWAEPIYRGVFGLLREFGDAEIASLIAPRRLVIEHSRGPDIKGPPATGPGRRQCAAPGRLEPAEFDSVAQEVSRARRLVTSPVGQPMGPIFLVANGESAVDSPGSDRAITEFLKCLGVESKPEDSLEWRISRTVDAEQRQRRQVVQLLEHSQRLLHSSAEARQKFWKDAKAESHRTWSQATQPYREYLWNEVLGKLPDPPLPVNPRTRIVEDRETWTTHEVMLDVWPDVFAWGYLLVPRGIEPDERRPVVVCQHGLEGLPSSVINEDQSSRDWHSYRAYANRLAARGFVVYAPHNPYRGKTAFRQLQRKANPLKLTLYSFIAGQHQRALEWLATLPFVDPDRIGFYGLSYGGTTAVRIPPLLDGYAFSICSAAFNDWARKVVTLDFRAAYVFTAEYDHFYFNQANTFNNADLAALMAPRPFMVERGHDDGVAPDEWVAFEYAKVRRLYTQLGVTERTEIEFFEGGHWINGQGTFDFLHRHLDWPGR